MQRILFIILYLIVMYLLWVNLDQVLHAETTSQTAGPGLDLHFMELEKIDLDYKEVKNYRDDYFPQYETINGQCTGYTATGERSTECMQYGAAIGFDINAIRTSLTTVQWRNTVDMDATNKQVRQVGWNWELGLTLGPRMEIFEHHHSRHMLDDSGIDKYPLRDEYVLRFHIYQRGK